MEQLAINALNKAKLSYKAQQKVAHIGELHELLIKNDLGLLDKYLPAIVEFQVDKAASVRKRLVEFLAAAVQVRGTPPVLNEAAACLSALLVDEQAAVAKQAAVVAHVVFKTGLALHAAHRQGSPAADATWAAAQHLQAAVSSLAGNNSVDTGLRMAGIKMSEQAVLTYAGPGSQLPDAAALATAADGLLRGICDMLKAPKVQRLPGPVVICCIKALGTVALQQGHLVAKSVPALLALGAQGIFKAPSPDDGQSAMAASCGAALKDILVRLLRSNADAVRPWQKRLEAALRTMGAGTVADSALRHLERLAARSRASEKRKAADQGGPDAKIARPNTPGAESSVNNTPARTPTPTSLRAGDTGTSGLAQQQDLLASLLPGGLALSGNPFADVQRVIEALVAHEQHQAVETLVSQIPTEMLAELTWRWMDNLPPKPAAPITSAASTANAAATATPLIGPSSTPQIGQDSLGFAAQSQQQLQQSPARRVKQEGLAGTAAAAAAVKQQQPVDPRRQRTPPPAAASTAAAAAFAGDAAARGLPQPLPMSLSTSQAKVMHKAALQRILGANKNKPIRNLRELLLSRLASQGPATEDVMDLILQHVMDDYHGQRGHELVVRWLYALAVALTARAAGKLTGIAGSAAAAAGAGTAYEPTAADADMAEPDNIVRAVFGDLATPAGSALAAGEGSGPEASAIAAAQQHKGQQGTDVRMHNADGPATQPAEEQQQQQQADRPAASNSREGDTGFSNGIVSSSKSSVPSDLTGTVYETVLMAALQGLKQHLPGSDPAIQRLLQDSPILPLSPVIAFLQRLVDEGSGWAALALNAAQVLIDTRPLARDALLHLVLRASVADEPETGKQAVEMVVKELMSWPSFVSTIIDFARAQLMLLLEPGKLLKQQQQQHGEQGGQGVPAAADLKQEEQQGQEQQQHMQQERQTPNGDAAKQQQQHDEAKQEQRQASGNNAGSQQQQHQQPEGHLPSDMQGEGPAAAVVASQQEQQQEHQEEELKLTAEVAARHCMLFMALCAQKPELMTDLLEVYGQAGPEARAGLDRFAAALANAKGVGSTNPQLLTLIKNPPAGSKGLLLHMLHALADQALPPQSLVAACVANYTATNDVQILAPVLIALPKNDVIKLLPQLVTQLSKQQLRQVYKKLTSATGQQQAHFKPTELLVVLHQLKSTQQMRVTTKQQTVALDVALHAPDVFPVAVVVQAIRRLESFTPLPQLFMRTVICALQITPKLTDTIMELLKRLITKQVWNNDKQWQGFIICCEKAAPASYPVLLQLPPNVLEVALDKLPERHWRELLKYATSKDCTVPVFQPVRDVLNLFLERLTNRQKAKVAAAAAAAAGETTGTSTAAASAATAANNSSIASAKSSKPGSKPSIKSAAAAVAKRKQPAAAMKPTKPPVKAAGTPASAAAAAAADKQQQRSANVAASQPNVAEQQQPTAEEDEFMLDFEDDE